MFVDGARIAERRRVLYITVRRDMHRTCEHSKNADLRRDRSRWLPKLNMNILVERYISRKILITISRNMSHVVGGNVPSFNVEESFKRFPEPDRDADDFQNLTISSLSKDPKIHLWKNFHDDPISSFYVKLLRDKETPDKIIICDKKWSVSCMDFILRVYVNIILNELRQQRVKYDVHTTSKIKHTRHFLSYIIFIANLSAILIGTIL